MENDRRARPQYYAEQLGVDADGITLESSFREDLEADSLDLVELMALRRNSGARFPTKMHRAFRPVGDAVEYVVPFIGHSDWTG